MPKNCLALAFAAVLIVNGSPAAFAQSNSAKESLPEVVRAALDGDAVAQFQVGLAWYADGVAEKMLTIVPGTPGIARSTSMG